MFKVSIRPEWLMATQGGTATPLPVVLRLLSEIDRSGNIAAACKTCALSYRHAWGQLRKFEAAFGVELLITSRRQGTRLSPFAQKLLWADKRIHARLAPTLESLASELEAEIESSLPDQKPNLRMHASHGFAVAALKERLENSPITLELKYEGSVEALASLCKGSCKIAGFHVPIGPMRAAVVTRYAKFLKPKQQRLVHLAVRTQGIITAADNPKNIRTLADFARSDVMVVNRQPGSGTRTLLDLLLEQAGIDSRGIRGYENGEFTHAAVAAYIASGMADAGFGIETGARRFGLDFIPMLRENYYFAFYTSAQDQSVLATVLATLQEEKFRAIVNRIPGYDGSRCGEVVNIPEELGISSR